LLSVLSFTFDFGSQQGNKIVKAITNNINFKNVCIKYIFKSNIIKKRRHTPPFQLSKIKTL